MPDTQTHIIIGGGLAGAKAAEALRLEGFDGRIVLVAEEQEAPYERPPLSKDYLRGESPRADARVHADGFYAEHAIELRTGTPVASITPATTEVRLADGDRLSYDRLLVATGSRARRLDVPGAELDGVVVLRTLADADELRARLPWVGHLLVVGAGWIGAEVAASARQIGVDVTIVERAEVPLQHVLGRDIGAIYAALHRDHGVQLLTAAEPESFAGDTRVEAVRLRDGRLIDCDLVVVGIGATPRTELVEPAGVAIGDGILVDRTLETNIRGIYAAGDVANVAHPFYRRRVRVEHWANALYQPVVAARAMLDKPAVWDRLPYFYSDQYDIVMEYVGLASGEEDVIIRGNRDTRELLGFWLRDERVVAGMTVNVGGARREIERLIRRREPVDRVRLADAQVPLAEVHTAHTTAPSGTVAARPDRSR